MSHPIHAPSTAVAGFRRRWEEARPLLGPALLWCVLHGLLALVLFGGPLLSALERLAPALRPLLLAGGVVQALFLGLLTFVVTLPLVPLGRRYALVPTVLSALAVVMLTVDSLVLASLGFHINGLVLAVALQPRALAETGLSSTEVGLAAAGAAALLGLDVWAGVRFVRRFQGPHRVLR
ncbi:DUF3413 domain-containing protein, partial [Pyxidicoccus sp. 3LG]